MNKNSAQRSESTLQVVHAVPGRVRFRSTGQKLVSTVDSLAQQLRQKDGVSEVRINPTANSLVVTFDVSALSLSQLLEEPQMTDLSYASGKTELLPELNLNTFLPEQTKAHSRTLKTSPLAESDTSVTKTSLKVAQSVIPLVAGMAVTAGLGIEGLLTFPVYMIADNLTRQIIKQVESQLLGEAEETRSKANSSEAALKPSINSSQINSINNQQSTIKHSEKIAYKIVHEISGRIRFRVPRIATDAEYTQKLTAVMEADANVTDVRVNTAASSIAVSYDVSVISDDKMRSHLVNLIQTADRTKIPISLKTASTQEEAQDEPNLWYQLGFPVFTTTLALLGGPLGVPIPPLIIGGSIAIAALPVAQRAIEGIITEKRLTIDFLDLSAITITTLQGHFISPAIMISLVEIGEAIREQTARSSKKQTLDLLGSLEQFVWVERDGEKQQISIHDVKRGDIVIVYPGDQIPVDGQIIRGKALIDEQKLTGESMPVMRKKGQNVYTSTLIREGQIYILTEQVGADTRAGQIIKVMQDAPVHDTRIENYAATVANQAVVPTLLLSGVVFAFTRNFARAASILTLDFATGIRVSVPTTVLAALTHAARRGILIRSGRTLEKLAQVDAVVFDKTGTLTRGEAVIVTVETENESISPLQVLELAASAEQRLTHPVAEAIVRYAEEQGVTIPPREKWEYEIGQGVRAKINGQDVLVGSEHFLREEGVYLNGKPKKHAQHSHSVIYVASNGQLQGVIAYRDPLRAESPKVIQALRTVKKMEIHLLTGDNKRTASAVAQELGIAQTHTHAEAFPEQKVAVVKGLHDKGKTVAFVGDGINDSPALAYADVSVSFANGSDVARETADVVLMENNLNGLPEAIAIARQAMQLIHQNTGIVAIPNLGALVLAVALGIDPLAATLVNNGTTVVAGLNGLRPLLNSSDEELDLVPDTIDIDTDDQNSEISQPVAVVNEPINEQPISEMPLSVQALDTTIDNSKIVTMASVKTIENGHISNNSNGHAVHHSNGHVGNNLNGHAVKSLNGHVVHHSNGHVDNNSNGHAEKSSQEIPGEVLTGVALAHRLNVSETTVSRRKSKADFSQWARSKDPEGLSWKYSKKSKQFVAYI
jgi:P-type Cu2+ transporter